MRIEDYGFIGDTQTGALVGRDGVGRLAVPPALRLRVVLRGARGRRAARALAAGAGGRRAPRALVATGRGRWCSRPSSRRRTARCGVIDFMPRRAEGPPRLMRIVEGLRGRVPMRMELVAAAGLRVDHAVGGAGVRRGDRHRRARRVPAQHAAGAGGPRRNGERRLRRRRGCPRAAHPHAGTPRSRRRRRSRTPTRRWPGRRRGGGRGVAAARTRGRIGTRCWSR